MLFSTIGRCAVIQLVFSLVASPPPTAANQFYRGSSRHHTVDGCTSFTEKISCLTGTGGCTWHPLNGCVSATSTTESSERGLLTGGEEENSGDDEARTVKVSRNLQVLTRSPTSKPTTRRPTTRKPTRNPTTRRPTSKPTTTRSPTSKPTTRSPVSCSSASW
jgi:hypothetical protein